MKKLQEEKASLENDDNIQIIKDGCLDYATVQESIGTIYLMTANLPQAKTHFKKALKIYEKVCADGSL